jgi:hypothetical protein
MMVVMVINIYDKRLKVIHGLKAHIMPAYTIQWVPLIVVGPIDTDVEVLCKTWKRPSQLLDICRRLHISPPIQIRAEIPDPDLPHMANEEGDATVGSIRIRKK